jgi:hypothetical protein
MRGQLDALQECMDDGSKKEKYCQLKEMDELLYREEIHRMQWSHIYYLATRG